MTAAPADAHSRSSNFRTAVASVAPQLPRVSVQAGVDGSYIELTNTGSSPVVVYGYEQEPYLRVNADGVEENTLSPATYLNESLQVGSVPSGVDPKAAPVWHRVADGPTYRWHDHRVHWANAFLPPAVQSAPDKPHVVSNWTIRAVGTQPFTITGTVAWTPYRSNSTAQILGGVAGAALFVTGGAVLVRRNRRRQQRAPPTSGAESRSADKVLTRTRPR